MKRKKKRKKVGCLLNLHYQAPKLGHRESAVCQRVRRIKRETYRESNKDFLREKGN